MKTHKFARKTFYVDAVRVSEANIKEVAEWCGGTLEEDSTGHVFVSVKVHNPRTDRQSQAFIGDWVLYANNSYKVYTPKAFDKSFEKAKVFTKEQADAAGIKVPHEPRPANEKKAGPKPTPPKKRRTPDNPVLSPELASQLQHAREQASEVGQKVGAKISHALKPIKEDADYRSAKTGQYVSQETAEANPDTTVKETSATEVTFSEAPKKSKADVEADKLINEVLKEN